MPTGKDLATTLLACSRMLAGHGFAGFCDLDENPGIAMSGLDERAKQIVDKRMAKAVALSRKLVGLCKKSGIFWIHPKRGRAVNLDQELTCEEAETLAALNKLRLTPALLRGEGATVLKLRGSIRAELVIAGIILLATAVFTTVVGPAG